MTKKKPYINDIWLFWLRASVKLPSDAYDIWYDTRSDIYDFQYDLKSEVYNHDDERAQKKMDKFKKSILRMKEDVND